jgi:hypothetical protein
MLEKIGTAGSSVKLAAATFWVKFKLAVFQNLYGFFLTVQM